MIELHCMDNLELMKTIEDNMVDYKNKDWLYEKYTVEKLQGKEIANLCKVSIGTINYWIKKYKLNRKYNKENYTLTKNQFDLFVGSYFGDGGFSYYDYKDTTRCNFSHANNQLEYLEFKYKIVNNMCRTYPKWQESNKINRFSTLSFRCLSFFIKNSKEVILDFLNEMSLSIWLLDDGNRTKYNWSLSFQRFEHEFKLKIRDKLYELFALKGNLVKCGAGMILQFTSESSRRLDSMILKNIPNDIDVVKYKILEKEISKPKIKKYVCYNDCNITLYEYCKIKNISYDSVKNKTSLDGLNIFLI